MNIYTVYITVADKDEAVRIGKALVEERLAACTNILEGVTSLYWWEGKIQQDRECVLLAKTKESCVPPLLERVKALHSYDCPCIEVYQVDHGHPPFLAWVHEQTR